MTMPTPRDESAPDRAAASRVERMVASFEAEATAEPLAAGDESGAVDYAVRITRVQNAVAVVARDAHPPDAGLKVADAEVRLVADAGEQAVVLRRVEILQGFDFDVATGRVTGLLLFDREVTEDGAGLLHVETVPTRVMAAVEEGRVSVLAADGVHQHYDATLRWTNAATDLDVHGFHFTRGGMQSHVWHGHRPLGPVFWHNGPSTADALDEQLVITSVTVDGLILCVVHSPLDMSSAPVRLIAESGAQVELQLPNARQRMQFEAPSRDGNLWVPFAILDGRLITTDVVATVYGTPGESDLRAMLGDLFAGLPVPLAVTQPMPYVPDTPVDDWRRWQGAALGLGSLAVALTVLVWLARGAGRGAIMALMALLVLYLAVSARTSRR